MRVNDMASEDGFTLIFKYSPTPGLVLLPEGPNNIIVSANDAFLSLFKLSEDEIAGKSYFDVFHELPRQKLSRLRQSFQKALSDQASDVFQLEDYQASSPADRFAGARLFEIENIPVPDSTGRIAYILHSVKDVTSMEDSAARMKRLDELHHLEREVLDLNFRNDVSMKELLTRYIKGIEAMFPKMQCSILKNKDHTLHNWSSPSLPLKYLQEIENLPVKDNVGSCGTAAYRKEIVVTKDIAIDPRWEQYKHIAMKYGFLACWSYPIINAEGEVIATFGMYYKEMKEPDPDERKIIDRATSILKILIENRQHLEKIHETTVLMEQAQQIAGFGTWSWDLEAGEVEWSTSLFAMFGIPEHRSAKRYDEYYQLIHKDDVKRVTTYLSEALQNPREIKYEARIIRGDGEVRHHKTWAELRKDESGKAVKLIGACLDITESKLIQEKLQMSENRLRSLLDSQTNYVIRTDLDGKYTYYNNKYKEDFGWLHPRGSLIGLDSMNSVLPHHHRRVYDTAELCRLNPNTVYVVELDKYQQDGQPRSTIWHFICLTDLSGAAAEIQCIGIDNTERKRSEDELKASHKRYRELFHLSPQPMWVYDVDTLKFLDVNEAAIRHYGYSHDEFLAMDLRTLRSSEDIPMLLQAVNSLKGESGLVHHGIFRHQKKNGETIYVDMRSNMIPYNDKVTYIALANDVTERLHYINAIEKQNRRFKEIAWMQSHVMRAPVARIMSLVDLLNNHQNTEEERTEFLDYILQSAHELDKIVKEISDQTRD